MSGPPRPDRSSDQSMHILSGVGTLFITSILVGVVIKSPDWASASTTKKHDPLEDMEIIDAALAELPRKPEHQPQKPKQAPPPPDKPQTVSHDDQSKPVTRPDEPSETKPNTPDLDQFRRENNDDPIGPPDQQPVGAFDGSEFGFGDETKGDPYLGALKADLLRNWEYPEILDDVGTPVGCIHVEPDGKILDWELREKSGNFELDDSVERALGKLKKLRDDKPKQVPLNLIPLTRKWICYRMKVKE